MLRRQIFKAEFAMAVACERKQLSLLGDLAVKSELRKHLWFSRIVFALFGVPATIGALSTFEQSGANVLKL